MIRPQSLIIKFKKAASYEKIGGTNVAFTTQTILLVDGCLEDRINYARYLLQEIPHYCIILEAQIGEEGLSICRQQFPDVILLNYELPDMDGLEFLNKLKTQSNQINFPVIVLTEQENSKIAVQVIKSGAVDYLVKNNLTAESFCLAVENVLEQPFLNPRQQSEETLQVYAAELEELYYNAPCGYHSLDADGIFIRINDTELKMLGYSRKELIGKKKMSDLLTPESLLIYQENFPRFKERGWVRDLEFQALRKDGKILPISLSATAVKDTMGNYLYSHSVLVDISERQASLAEDLKDTQLLRNLSAKLLSETDIQVFYDEIVATAIALMQADGGTLQILDEAKQELLLLATQGFEQTMTEHFYRVPASSNTSCGIALATNTRTFVDFDVPKSDDPDGSLRMHADAGYLSAQLTLLITRSGKPIGMVSTHWHKHHRPSDRELRFLDLLAR